MTTKEKPADGESAGKIKGDDSLTTEVYPQHRWAHPPRRHPLPIPDNTLRTLFDWAMDLDITQGARMVLLTVIRHVDWEDWYKMHSLYPHSGP